MRGTERFGAVYGALAGLAIVAWWGVALASGRYGGPDDVTASVATHVGAELLTSVVLWVGVAGLVARRAWARRVHALGLGMLLYATANVAGAFVEAHGFYVAGALALSFAVTLVWAWVFVAMPSASSDAANGPARP